MRIMKKKQRKAIRKLPSDQVSILNSNMICRVSCWKGVAVVVAKLIRDNIRFLLEVRKVVDTTHNDIRMREP